MSFPFLDFSSSPPYQQIFDYDIRTDMQPVYIGWATCGVATSASSWKIRKFAYNVDGSVATITYANGDVGFRAKWDDRATLTYK